MGVLTRYLDLLPAEARERVRHAQQWTAECHVEPNGARNLLGHAEDWTWQAGQVPSCRAPAVFRLRAAAGDELWTDESQIGRRFLGLVRRCGLERAVELVRRRLEHDAARTVRRVYQRGRLRLWVDNGNG